MIDSSEFDSHLYRTAVGQLDGVAKRLGLDADVHERLRHPRRALVVSVPIKMDTGKTQVFRDVPLDTAIEIREDATTFTVRPYRPFRLGPPTG